MSFGIGEPAWSVQLRMARNPFPSFEPEWERQLRRARDPIQPYNPSLPLEKFPQYYIHGPICPLPSGPTLFERLKKADEEWEAHRLETGKKLLASGTPPQFAWEENALSFTERMTGVKRQSTEQYIPVSVFPKEEITGFKTRTYNSLLYQGIEPLTPKPEPLKLKCDVTSILTKEEPKTFISIFPQKEPEDKPLYQKEFERRMEETRMQERFKKEQEEYFKRACEHLNPQPKKPWEVDPFSGVSPLLTTRSGTTRYPGTDPWSKTLSDSSYIIGERGSGTHTHMGTDRNTGKEFVNIKDEKKGKSVFWTFIDKLFSL